jgi:hypothetical protein
VAIASKSEVRGLQLVGIEAGTRLRASQRLVLEMPVGVGLVSGSGIAMVRAVVWARQGKTWQGMGVEKRHATCAMLRVEI